jgi:hypothetical protein
MSTKQKKKYSNYSFEFLLKKNNHIICQRYFNIDNYNSDVLNSNEVKKLMDSLAGMNNGEFGSCGLIPSFLKSKSVDFLWDRYNPFSEFNVENDNVSRNIFENEEFFTFEIRVNKRIVGQSIFSGNYFPTAVRYQVNIKEIIPDIINEITECFSREEYFIHD